MGKYGTIVLFKSLRNSKRRNKGKRPRKTNIESLNFTRKENLLRL